MSFYKAFSPNSTILLFLFLFVSYAVYFLYIVKY